MVATEKRSETAALDIDFYEIDAMREEEVTLYLARCGHSPEDVRQAMDRLFHQMGLYESPSVRWPSANGDAR